MTKGGAGKPQSFSTIYYTTDLPKREALQETRPPKKGTLFRSGELGRKHAIPAGKAARDAGFILLTVAIAPRIGCPPRTKGGEAGM